MIRYTTDLPTPGAYRRLFGTTGWDELYRASAEELRRTLERSWHVVTAHDGGELVGSGRTLSDGVLYAVVFDLIVHPSRRGEGIGSGLLRRLVERCDEAGIRDVLLFAAGGTESFYRRHGFERRPEEAPGMMRRRRPAG